MTLRIECARRTHPLGNMMSGRPLRLLGLALGMAFVTASPLAFSQVRVQITTTAQNGVPPTNCVMTTDANGLSLVPGGTNLQATGVTFDPAGCGQGSGGILPPTPDNFALAGIPATISTLPSTFTVTWSVANAATCVGLASVNGFATTLAGWTDSTAASPQSRSVTITTAGNYILAMICANAASPPVSVTSQAYAVGASGGGNSCPGPGGDLTRLMTSDISYGVNASPFRSGVDVTEWNNIWGHATTVDLGTPWPGISGAGPVVREFNRHKFLAAHFNTGSVPMYQGSLADQSNLGGPDIDIVVSQTCGDFSPNATFPGCSISSAPSDGQPHFKYFSNGGNAGTIWCPLQLNTDYWINIKLHDENSGTECSVANPVCPLFTINYWSPAP
jgi:hypothetical protein